MDRRPRYGVARQRIDGLPRHGVDMSPRTSYVLPGGSSVDALRRSAGELLALVHAGPTTIEDLLARHLCC